ncbi:MAG: hypothetical protein JWM68_5655 [Verrucomicrobiales bacterium]|nr:hypothetical protein [Verrucomicrobiales bacterium]
MHMNNPSMSVVLKNFTESFYLKNSASWTTDIHSALQFDSVDRAKGFCVRHDLSDFQAVPFFPKKSQLGIAV